jgi:glycosyltransferase involved in cell wall biosynthesis
MEKPLISFVVVAFNQEQFIREAVQGALAQTYSPLEIIISDDASKDRTFEVIRELVDAYKGTHSVRINRNEVNLGMGAHISSLMKLCNGKLIVGAAGDDISLPDRTEALYQAWEGSGRRATSIFSSYITISETGEEFGVGGTRGDLSDGKLYRPQNGSLFNFLSTEWPVVVGCTHAWSPSLFEAFGPLISDLEDLVLSFRSLAIGEMLYVDRPLIKYRRHGANVSFLAGKDDARTFEHRERRLHWVNVKKVAAYDNMIADVKTLARFGRISAEDCKRLQAESNRMREQYDVERQMMDANFFGRLFVVIQAVVRGRVRCAVRSLPRVLPKGLYRSFYLTRQRWRDRNLDKGVSVLGKQGSSVT